jgi:hypothetical protein
MVLKLVKLRRSLPRAADPVKYRSDCHLRRKHEQIFALTRDELPRRPEWYNGSLGLEHTGTDRKAVAESRAGSAQSHSAGLVIPRPAISATRR